MDVTAANKMANFTECSVNVEKVVKVDGTIEKVVEKRAEFLEVVREKGSVRDELVVLVGDVGDVGKIINLVDMGNSTSIVLSNIVSETHGHE